MTKENEGKRAYFPELPFRHRAHLIRVMHNHVNFEKYPELFEIFQLLSSNGQKLAAPSVSPSTYLIGPVAELSRHADRAPASSGHAETEKLLVKHLAELNLVPAFDDHWTQPITSATGEIVGNNIGGILKGRNDQYIALIAHYDTVPGSPGAEDNAAAIGITLEVINQLQGWSGDCNILVLFPDVEEPPNFHTDTMGSTYFFNHSPIPVDRIRCAIVMDLVGHDLLVNNREDGLFVMGSETAGGLLTAVNNASKEVPSIQVYPVRNRVLGVDYSDHHVFALNHRPFLFLSCGIGPNYHSSNDTFQKISPSKIVRVSQFLVSLLLQLDSMTAESTTSNQQAILKAEADGYKRFTGLELTDNAERLNEVGSELMNIINSGAYHTLEEVQERVSKCGKWN
ncbi:MAG TPA: M28 family peptidase [Desulfosporosinus sp.]|nr:M28 family peptidase [Desulfosporosinus sp.]